MDDYVAAWGNEVPGFDCTLEEVEHFNARGMRLVYGRNDCFGRYHSFNMDIWRAREGNLFVRLWSRCTDIDWRSFRIIGIDLATVPCGKAADFVDDEWIPVAVRQAYDEWITEEW